MNDDDGLPPTDDDGWGSYSSSEKTGDTRPEPKAERPTTGEAKTGEAKTGEAKTGEAKTGEAKTGEAKTGEAQTDEAQTGEPKTERPKFEEPKTGPAKADGTKAGTLEKPRRTARRAGEIEVQQGLPKVVLDAAAVAGEPKSPGAPQNQAAGSKTFSPTAGPARPAEATEPGSQSSKDQGDTGAAKKKSSRRWLSKKDKSQSSAGSTSSDEPRRESPADSGGKSARPARKKKPPAGGGRAGGKRWRWVIAAVAVLALGGLGTLSYLNAQKYYFVCHPQKITAEKGRLFPVGRSQLSGEAWKPITIDEAYDCQGAEYSSERALSRRYVGALIDRAESALADDDVAIDQVASQLDQAMLLTRGDDQRRKRAIRLSGDVEYRRARRDIEEIREGLERAAARFEEAAKKRPIHATDSGEWSTFASELREELSMGPRALRPESEDEPDEKAPLIPAPSADAGAGQPATDVAPAQGPGSAAAAPDAGPPPAPDAAPAPKAPPQPRGGVLL